MIGSATRRSARSVTLTGWNTMEHNGTLFKVFHVQFNIRLLELDRAMEVIRSAEVAGVAAILVDPATAEK